MSRLVCHGASLKTSRDKRLFYRMFIVKLASQQEHSEMPNGVFFLLSTFLFFFFVVLCLHTLGPLLIFRLSPFLLSFPLDLLLAYDFFLLSFSYLSSFAHFLLSFCHREIDVFIFPLSTFPFFFLFVALCLGFITLFIPVLLFVGLWIHI